MTAQTVCMWPILWATRTGSLSRSSSATGTNGASRRKQVSRSGPLRPMQGALTGSPASESWPSHVPTSCWPNRCRIRTRCAARFIWWTLLGKPTRFWCGWRVRKRRNSWCGASILSSWSARSASASARTGYCFSRWTIPHQPSESRPAIESQPGNREGAMVNVRRQPRISWEALLLSLPALLFVVAMFILPFLFGLNLSLHTGLKAEGELTLSNYLQFFNDPTQSDAIGITFQVALPVTLFSIVISIPLAYYMRRGIRFERFITTLLILPLTLGNVMVAQSMLMYYGRQGWFNQALQAIGLIKQPLALVHNWIGVEIALFIQNFPFVFLMILGYMSGINPDLERASRMLGASAWRTFWRVIWPLILPGVAIAFCLNFVANFTVFPSAVLVGRPDDLTKVLSIVAFRAAYE